MGQYFLIVNLSKKEYVHPHCIGGGLKLWELCANNEAGIFPYLLRQSSEKGGGDINVSPEEYKAQYDEFVTDESKKETFLSIYGEKGTVSKYAGRWAGDRITVVGDYDDSKLYEIAEDSYKNISHPLKKEYNKFLDYKERELGKSWCSHEKNQK